MPGTGTRSSGGSTSSPRPSATENPHPKREIPAASLSRRSDKRSAAREHPLRNGRRKELEMRKFWEIGGVVAAALLVAFGIVAIVMGVSGRSTVQDSLKLE